jgi:hypothetical protein
MKKRIRKVANFFAFNLLFFALYLNFIHKDKTQVAAAPQAMQQNAAFSETALADHPKVIEKKSEAAMQQPTVKNSESNTAALKLSIN